MRNLLITGSGRSGTSALAGLFRESGAFMGGDLLSADESNPTGFFEDRIVNRLNDKIILSMTASRMRRARRLFFTPQAHWDIRCLWLASPRRLRRVQLDVSDMAALEKFAASRPFCFKDPRFSVTLPTWMPHFSQGVRFIVVFREPTSTVASIRQFFASRDITLSLTDRWLYKSWCRNYRRLLRDVSDPYSWMFVDYQDVLSGRVISAIESFSETKVDTHAIDAKISKNQSVSCATAPLTEPTYVYRQLKNRAEHDIKQWGSTSGI